MIQRSGLSALTLAIILGMLAGNLVLGAGESRYSAGIAFGKQALLRFGIVLYGLRLTFQDIAHVGIAGLAIDAVMLSCTFLLAWWAGTRWFHLDRLIRVGRSCFRHSVSPIDRFRRNCPLQRRRDPCPP